MKSNGSDDGFVAVLLLVVPFLLLSALLSVHLRIRLAASRVATMKQQLQLTQQLHSARTFSLMNAFGIAMPSTVQDTGMQHSDSKVLAQFPPHVFIENAYAQDGTKDSATLLLVLLREVGAAFEVPDWKILLTSPGDQPCNEWIKEAGALGDNPYGSVHTCRVISDTHADAVLIPGNLTLHSPLQITRRSEREMYIMVKGNVTLEYGIELADLQNVTIHLLALGHIRISAVSTRNVRNTKLLLHSTGANISLNDALESYNLCNSDFHPETLLLRLEARTQIVTRSGSWNGPISLGCFWNKETRFWPGLKVLGSLG